MEPIFDTYLMTPCRRHSFHSVRADRGPSDSVRRGWPGCPEGDRSHRTVLSRPLSNALTARGLTLVSRGQEEANHVSMHCWFGSRLTCRIVRRVGSVSAVVLREVEAAGSDNL